MMLELRDLMGAESFDAALREYVSIHSHRIATPRALLDLLQRRTSPNLNPTVYRYVKYGAFGYPAAQLWSSTLSSSTPSVSADLVLEASFPIGVVEVWLDNQLLVSRDIAGARGGTLALDLSRSSAGDHVLQTRIWNDEGAQFEQDTRVTIR
jgi:hypothetical protein